MSSALVPGLRGLLEILLSRGMETLNSLMRKCQARIATERSSECGCAMIFRFGGRWQSEHSR
jgi:hypothetical protein